MLRYSHGTWSLDKSIQIISRYFKSDILCDGGVHGVGLFACFFSMFPPKMPWNARGNVRNAKPNRKMDGATCAWDCSKRRIFALGIVD